MLAATASGAGRLGDTAAPLPAQPPAPQQLDLPSGLSLHTNWIDSSDEEKEDVAASSKQAMKSLAAAAAAGGVCSGAAASPDCFPRVSPAHLIAPSRTTAHSLEIRASWPAAKKLARSLSMGSPRISAMPAPASATAGGPEEGRPASLGSLLRRLSQQLHRSSSSATVAAPSEPAPAQAAAAAAAVELAEGEELELLLTGVHSAASNCDLGTPAGAGAVPFSHLSPAHLLAPAQPAFARQPGTDGVATPDAPAAEAAADGKGSPLLDDSSSDPAASAERAAPLMDVLQWQVLSQQLEEQEQQGGEWDHLSGEQPMQQAPLAVLDGAAPAAGPQATPTSSATSGCYDPLVAASRYLGSVGHETVRSSASSSPPASGTAGIPSSCRQLLGEEGQVRRSLTDRKSVV